MKHSFTLLATVLLTSTFAFAVDAPDVVILKNKQGNITLQHKTHGQSMSCSTCHGDAVGKLLPLGKDRGHAMCLACHKTSGGTAPTKCGDCHKK